jgi:hypothetical protein
MAIDTTISCPNCKTPDCRKSKWHSTAEMRAHPNSHPYRCRLCAHRFHVRDRLSMRQGTVVFSSVLSFTVVVSAITALFIWTFDDVAAPVLFSAATPIDSATVRAAQQGDAAAQYRIARSLLLDPSQDREKTVEAVRWLESAAAKDHTGAMVQLGRLYRSGVGMLQDFELAVKWTRTAAVRGDFDGMHELGRLYRDGVGLDRDLVLAYIWLNRAAAAHNQAAARERDEIARRLSMIQLKEAQGQSARFETAANGHTPADPRTEPVRGAHPVLEVSAGEKSGKTGKVD